MREIKGMLLLRWAVIEKFFDTVQQVKARKYAYQNTRRLIVRFGPFPTSTAPGWTAYGRMGAGTNNEY
jgi:hypothetical protein